MAIIDAFIYYIRKDKGKIFSLNTLCSFSNKTLKKNNCFQHLDENSFQSMTPWSLDSWASPHAVSSIEMVC